MCQYLEICPKQQFEMVIKNEVKPFFKQHGFKKKGLNFSKIINEMYYLINFQKSHGNSHDSFKFYVNCGIYSYKIAQITGTENITFPKEYDCHYRWRIEQITQKDYQAFVIDKSSDINLLITDLMADLDTAVSHLLQVDSTEALVNMNLQQGLLNFEEFCRYLLLTNNETLFQQYYAKLSKSFKGEKRWQIIKGNLETIADEVRNLKNR